MYIIWSKSREELYCFTGLMLEIARFPVIWKGQGEMLQDNYGRRFTYLRLSVTEACNFRCSYCLPNGYQIPPHEIKELSVDEIRNLIAAFSELGIKKVRITGGEPCLRTDLIEIIQAISEASAIKHIALTSNGTRLNKYLDQYVRAGVSALNISLDTLDRKKFKEITGVDKLRAVLRAIDHALTLPSLQSIKINAVLMAGQTDVEFSNFLEYVKDKAITMRFIELMQTGCLTKDFLSDRQMQTKSMIDELKTQGWTELRKNQHSGPALEFQHANFKGRMGFISPYADKFCESCNRLRISSQGRLQLCLFGQQEIDLRPFLQRADQKDDLKNIILASITQKDKTHYLHENNPGIRGNLASIGG